MRFPGWSALHVTPRIENLLLSSLLQEKRTALRFGLQRSSARKVSLSALHMYVCPEIRKRTTNAFCVTSESRPSENIHETRAVEPELKCQAHALAPTVYGSGIYAGKLKTTKCT